MRQRSRRVSAMVVAATVALLAGCAASPERPGDDEMTGVVVSGNDTCCLPLGGGIAKGSDDAIVLLDPDDFVEMWTEAHPDHPKGPIEPHHWLASHQGFRTALTDFTKDGDPSEGPAYVDLTEGRWRARFDGDATMVCLASTGRDDDTGEPLMHVRGCGLVDQDAPVGVTITVHFGGIGVEATR